MAAGGEGEFTGWVAEGGGKGTLPYLQALIEAVHENLEFRSLLVLEYGVVEVGE